ncbi:hypothetical protein [Limosilactobacillus caccae]|uniref:hypothetical protein n=1 Tax=Limosilactobacillus caccae TaxID=1926284 RepID=UPI0009713431|nr:hypothetical protein [Limosilactobacillus caccae]
MNIKSFSFDWNDYNGELSSFDRSQIMNIMEDYYNSDLSVAKIRSKYSISSNVRNLAKEFPFVYLEEKCPYDDSNLVKQLTSRTGYSTRIPQCPTCGHKLNSNCNCDGCREERRRIQEQKRELVILTYPTDIDKVKYEDLSSSSKIFLSALLHAGLNEEANKISGETIIENKLSPTNEFDEIILEHLLSKNIILIDPMSPIDAFSADNFPNEYYYFKVNYLVNVEMGSEGMGYLEYPDRTNIIQHHKEECLGMWRQIALYECLEYLVEQMNEARFNFNPQDKTRLVINHLIEEYSIGQIWNLIYGSVNNAAAWYQKSNVTKKHAANSVITTLNNRGDRAKAENWKLKSYRRSYNNKLSQLSMVFFDSILQIGNEGFEKIPSIDLISC